MEEFEKNSFEYQWQNAFNEAEIAPSSGLWDKIKAGVVLRENSRYKKRVMVFKLLAAASIAFALSVAGLGLYFIYENRGSRSTLVAGENNPESIQKNEDAGHSDSSSTGPQIAEPKPIEGNEGINEPALKSITPERDPAQNLADASTSNNGRAPQLSSAGSQEAGPKPTGYGRKDQRELTERSAERPVAQAEEVPESLSHEGLEQRENVMEIAGSTSTGETTRVRSDNPSGNERSPDGTFILGVGPGKRLAHQDDVQVDDNAMIDQHVEITGQGFDAKALRFVYPHESMPGKLSPLGLDPQREPENSYIVQGVPIYWSHTFARSRDNPLWAGVNMTAGQFNPNSSVSGNQELAVANSLFADNADAGSEKEQPGLSYSYGLSVGKKLSKRWILQTGVQYAVQNASSNSSTYIENNVNGRLSLPLEATFDDASPASNELVVTSPYNVDNRFEYISLPLQAGYMLMDKKFGIVLNGGIMSSFLVGNTLTSDREYLGSLRVEPGSDSPYRSVQFSGLLGTEFVYSLGSHYQVSVFPSYQIGLQPLRKDAQGLELPTNFDLGFRFRYIFR